MLKHRIIFALMTVMILTVSAFISLSPLSAASKNLIVNGNAANGLKGWKTVDNYWKTAASYDQVSAYDSYFFFPQGFKGKDGASTRIYQDINISGYAGRKLTFSAYVRTWDTKNTDESVLMLEFFDSNGKLIDQGRQSSSCDPKWHRISVARTVPGSAVRVRASLCAVYHYGSEVDAYFDNVTLTADGSGSTHVKKPSAPAKKPGSNSAASKNLIVNGNAANGLKGWKTIDNYWKTAVSYDQVSAYDSYFFYPQGFKGKDGVSTRIYQDINISGYAGRKLTFSAYVRTWDTKNTDESVLMLEFFDSNGKLIDQGRQSSSCDPKWHRISVARTVPGSAVRVRASLCAVYHYGSEVDAYFDNVTLTAH